MIGRTTDRRTLLKGSAALGALSLTTAGAASAASTTTLFLYDSRIAESAAFAAQHNAQHRLDIAGDPWAVLRLGAVPAHIEGLTRWSDFVSAQAALAPHGLRVRHHTCVPAPLSGRDHLFHWTMSHRETRA